MIRHAKAPSAGSNTRYSKLSLGLAVLASSLAFGVSTAAAEAPTAEIDPVTESRYTTAHVSGTVDPKDNETFWYFEYQTEGGGWNFGGPFSSIAAGEGPTEVDFDLTGLTPGKEYEVRLVAANFFDPEVFSAEPNPTFTTEAVQAPTVSIDPVAAITASGADFSGTVDPNAPKDASETDEAEEGAFQSSWHFDCVPDCGFLSGEPIAADDGPAPVTAQVTGLEPNTEYTVTLHASNAGGTGEASETFTTEPAAPAIDSLSVSKVTSEDATLKAKLNPGGAATSWRFEWVSEAEFEANGFANADKAPVPDASVGSGKAPVAIAETVFGLKPGTEYRFRVVAANVAGTTESAAKAFQTFGLAKPPQQGEFPGQGFLPDERAWELVSPPQKLGSDVLAISSRTRASAGESAALPAGVTFTSLGGFGDVQGMGVAAEYLAQRTGVPGTNGWATHAISPKQESLTFGAVARSLEPFYEGLMAEDLSQGLFRSWSPLTDAPNVAEIPNLYAREDLRTPGEGTYRLVSDSVSPLSLPDPAFAPPIRPRATGVSEDFEHVLFESDFPLTSDAVGNYPKLYKTDGSTPRLVAVGPCTHSSLLPGQCSAAGLGARSLKYTPRVLSTDGSRAIFTAPVNTFGAIGGISPRPGIASRIFQLDDRGTVPLPDDATVQVSASEKPTPDLTQPAEYQLAATDGDRVFFLSSEQLTEKPGSGLYMWDRQDTDEVQQVAVDAEGGSFTLTAHTQPTLGRGSLTEGSTEVSEVDAGSFMVGQAVSGPGIPAGTEIVALGAFGNPAFQKTLTLSDPATETASGVEIAAEVEVTTPPLPFDAGAGVVQAALEALADDEGRRLLGEGNVEVSGGPGGPGGASPYLIAFTGALAGVNVAPLTADDGALTGGAATATVATPEPVQNLTLIAALPSKDLDGVVGASEDGHRMYFSSSAGQLVPGGPSVDRAVYYWQDADGTPGGTLSFVGGVNVGDMRTLAYLGVPGTTPKVTRVTPDGRHLLLIASVGSGLAPGYDHGTPLCPDGNANNNDNGGCSEAYVYSAESSSPTEPDLVCASCPVSGAPATRSARGSISSGGGGTRSADYLNRPFSEDGRRVFFSSAEALVPEDINGASDAYMYDVLTDTQHLISSGKDPVDSYFLEASADGHDAYFITREQLSGWDVDDAYDLYDARVEGGFPEPPPPPPSCQGDACQPAPAALNRSTPGSSTVSGEGNQRRPTIRRCRKGQRRVRVRNGKTRCVKRKTNRKRAASKDRRADR